MRPTLQEQEQRVRALSRAIAQELGIPYHDARPGDVFAETCLQCEKRSAHSFRILSCGYLPQIEGSPASIAPRLSDILDGMRAARSALRARGVFVPPLGVQRADEVRAQ